MIKDRGVIIMTLKLYLENPYLKEFDAKVVKRGNGYVILDQTAFYPESGGQEHDTGVLNMIKVTKVTRNGDDIYHHVDGMVGSDTVHGKIDWERRYSLMKMHTAQHIVSGILAKRHKVKTLGVSIKEKETGIYIEKLEVNLGVKTDIIEDFKDIVLKKVPLKFYEIPREKALKELNPMRVSGIQKLPAVIKNLRVVEVTGVDVCTCAGTHVYNTRELGDIDITRVEQEDDGTVIFFRLI